MLSINDAKLLRKLQRKKYRDQEEMFVAEGPKVVGDLLANGLQPFHIWSTAPLGDAVAFSSISEKELRQVSNFETPNQCIAIFKKPKPALLSELDSPHVLFLDGIRDPGNMGTLIRLADWFGITQLVCSPDCVDVFNFKTVQSSMGSLGNVAICTESLSLAIAAVQGKGYQVFGTLLQGKSVYEVPWPEKLVLILGSESHGISDAVARLVDDKVEIPKATSTRAESLNVAVAASICLGVIEQRKL